MKRKFYLGMLVAVSLLATSIFSSCSDDEDSNPGVKVEVSDISGTSAKISWNIISNQVIAHEVVVKEKASGSVAFEEIAGINLTTSEVDTEIEATGLSAETEYTVTVTALSIDAELNDVYIGEGSTDFTTLEGAALLEVEESEIVGTWYCSNWYYIFNDDGTGETGSHSSTFGDEKESDVTWEITSFDLDGTEVRSIKATDSDGYWTDLQVIKEGDVITLKDNDNNQTFELSGSNGGGDTPTVENIRVEKDNMTGGYMFYWDKVDGATSYNIYVNDESISDYPITGIPYTAMSLDLNDGDVIKIDAWDELTEKVIASGSITYSSVK